MPDTTLKEIAGQIQTLDKQVKDLDSNGCSQRCQGGMLSCVHLRDRIVDDAHSEEYLRLFKQRAWREIEKLANGKEEYEKKFLIRGFSEFNLTPFSYDLSLGSQVFSIQKPGEGVVNVRSEAPYPLQPGEAVIVMTEELIAIPPRYSATVWPRFNMVKKGVFQSMVKIDPTWYGNLSIAICNLSPSTVELKPGRRFATLILYELTKPTDVDLWRHQDLTEVEVPLTDEVQGLRDRLEAFLYQDRKDLTKYCRLRENALWVRGLKQDQVEDLKAFDKNPNWQKFVDDTVAPSWAKARHEKSKRRMIGMEGVGMTDLGEVIEVAEYQQLAIESFRGQACEFDDLTGAAVEYGRPFDLVPKVWTSLVQRMDERVNRTREETLPLIRAQVEAAVFPKTIALTLTVLGFLSLVVAVAVFAMEKWRPSAALNIHWSATLAVVVIALAIVVLVALGILLWPRAQERRSFGHLEAKLEEMNRRLDEAVNRRA